jgi:hypothetical protein
MRPTVLNRSWQNELGAAVLQWRKDSRICIPRRLVFMAQKIRAFGAGLGVHMYTHCHPSEPTAAVHSHARRIGAAAAAQQSCGAQILPLRAVPIFAPVRRSIT